MGWGNMEEKKTYHRRSKNAPCTGQEQRQHHRPDLSSKDTLNQGRAEQFFTTETDPQFPHSYHKGLDMKHQQAHNATNSEVQPRHNAMRARKEQTRCFSTLRISLSSELNRSYINPASLKGRRLELHQGFRQRASGRLIVLTPQQWVFTRLAIRFGNAVCSAEGIYGTSIRLCYCCVVAQQWVLTGLHTWVWLVVLLAQQWVLTGLHTVLLVLYSQQWVFARLHTGW